MKKNRIIILVIFLLFCCTTSKASTYPLGELTLNTLKLTYGDVSINTYKIYDTNYIAVSDLRNLGCNVEYISAEQKVNISAPLTYTTSTTTSSLNLNRQSYLLYSGSIEFEDLSIQGLNCNNFTLIPLASLSHFGQLIITDDVCTFIPKSAPAVSATYLTLTNSSPSETHVSVVDLYWRDEAIIETHDYTLAPYESIPRDLPPIDENTLYLTTLVQSIEGDGINYKNGSYLGQLNVPLLGKYSKIKNRTFLEEYGDITSIDEILQVEQFINSKNLSSTTEYLVWTDISTQRTYIFTGSTNNWELLKCFMCSTGRDHTPTPTGTFKLTYKVPSFGQNKGYCCKYAFGFIGTSYLYHSIIYDKTGTYLLENKGVLGKKASEGCIRFDTKNAKWFYDTMKSGSTVYIS